MSRQAPLTEDERARRREAVIEFGRALYGDEYAPHLAAAFTRHTGREMSRATVLRWSLVPLPRPLKDDEKCHSRPVPDTAWEALPGVVAAAVQALRDDVEQRARAAEDLLAEHRG